MNCKVLEKISQIIGQVATQPKCLTSKDIFMTLNIERATGFRLLQDLMELGLLRRGVNHKFELGIGAIYLGQGAGQGENREMPEQSETIVLQFS